jgi:cell wall-associated NlpC family hydrolase
VVRTAQSYLGVPYRNGGSDPAGFDCSGFVHYVFARHGVNVPRDVRRQWQFGRKVTGGRVRPGDLLFFSTTGAGPTHVSLAIDNQRFVHAPSSRGVVRIEALTSTYWGRRFLGARRVLP